MDGVCPSSVPSNFWEVPKNGRGLSIILCPIFEIFQKMDGICLSSVPSNFWELLKNGWGTLSLLEIDQLF